MNLSSTLAWLCLALALPSLSYANNAPASSDQEKLRFIQDSFAANAQHSRYWQNGWLSIFATSTVVHAGLWGQSGSDKESYDAKVTTITSTLATADMLLNPMRTHQYSEQLNDSNADLAQAEHWLQKAAEREQYERSFISHLSSAFVNGLAGLAVGRDDGRERDGWLTLATGIITSEVKIFTSPTGMSKAWAAYQNGDLSPLAATRKSKPHWNVAAAGPILQVQYRF